MFGTGLIIFYIFGPWFVELKARNLWIQKADCHTPYTCLQESVLGPGPLIVYGHHIVWLQGHSLTNFCHLDTK